jgi:3-hydroxybutyryl-CoA dehydrogenase
MQMRAIVIGSKEQVEECRQKFGDHIATEHSVTLSGQVWSGDDIVFDFVATEDTIAHYSKINARVIFTDSTFASVRSRTSLKNVFGFCGLPGFLNRPLLEVALPSDGNRELLKSVCVKLSTPCQEVKDEPGLVTPRVIGMIINEAYFALETETASRHDIDLAMKLGTNYPYGPFEWAEKIGRPSLCRLLQTLQAHSQDDRYQVSKLLLRESESAKIG